MIVPQQAFMSATTILLAVLMDAILFGAGVEVEKSLTVTVACTLKRGKAPYRILFWEGTR